jgi:succinoglycan biosynthesis transport protein ExoP
MEAIERQDVSRLPEPVAEVQIGDAVRTIWSRRTIAASAIALTMAAAVLYVFTATPIYQARTSILVDPEAAKLEPFKPPTVEERSQIDYYQTQFQILRSRSLAAATLDALNLWNHPEFAAGRKASSETARREWAVNRFEERLGILTHQDSRIVEVTFESSDPNLAAQTANALAQAYLAQNQDAHLSGAKESSRWLLEQVEQQRKAMEGSEAALQRYREQKAFLSIDDRSDIVTQKLTDLSAALTRAQTERLEKEALYQRVNGAKNADALGSFPTVQSSPTIQQLRTEIADLEKQRAVLSQQLGELHPDLVKVQTALQLAQARLGAEMKRIADATQQEYLNARNQEQKLSSALAAQKSAAIEHTRVGTTYETLQRRANTDRQIFEALLQRTKEMQISGELPTNNIRVVDRAEPPAVAIRPNKPLVLGLSFLGAMAFGIAAAFGSEYLDRRIRSASEIRTKLGLSFLGIVPAADNSKPQGRPLITETDRSLFADGIHALRANVLWRAADTRAVLVTSAAPEEGKTVVAANLAVTLAHAGRRVVLIDADMRRPQISAMFQLPTTPGLADVAGGAISASAAVLSSGIRHLSILPAGGSGEGSPSEFLGSPQFGSLLLKLGEEFDHIIIDSPPVLNAVDAGLIAGFGPAVLFVVGAQTDRQAAMEALERLAVGRATFLGAVLNRVAVGRGSAYRLYGYSDRKVA